ncbi:MAG: helix-hairpin-helix domain-containing protein [Legionella sp.]|nr:MAG: helix-hairpin-helix domain-containing protein [Legionella sp.]
MKANYFALLLSLSIINLPAYAATPVNPPTPVKQTVNAQAKIDLNKADLATLVGSFKGIGKKRAEAIIAYRESHAGFKAIEELAEVRGFGQKFVEKNREGLLEVFMIN